MSTYNEIIDIFIFQAQLQNNYIHIIMDNKSNIFPIRLYNSNDLTAISVYNSVF